MLPHNHDDNEKAELLAKMLTEENAVGVSELFKQVADPTRLRIFWILCHSEECVINLAAIMNISSPAVSHHLKLLKSAELAVSRREEKEVYYKAADTKKARLLHDTIESLEAIVCPDEDCFLKK